MAEFFHEIVSTARCLIPWASCKVKEVGYNLPLPVTFSSPAPVIVIDDDGIISSGEV